MSQFWSLITMPLVWLGSTYRVDGHVTPRRRADTNAAPLTLKRQPGAGHLPAPPPGSLLPTSGTAGRFSQEFAARVDSFRASRPAFARRSGALAGAEAKAAASAARVARPGRLEAVEKAPANSDAGDVWGAEAEPGVERVDGDQGELGRRWRGLPLGQQVPAGSPAR